MRVLGIDTGLVNLGWALVEVDDLCVETTVVDCDVMRFEADTFLDRARLMASWLDRLVRERRPDAVVYESPSIPPSAGSAYKVGLAFGVLAALRFPAESMIGLTPTAIKKALMPRWRPAKHEKTKGSEHSWSKNKREEKGRVIRAVARLTGGRAFSHVRKSRREHVADAAAAVVAAQRLGRLPPPPAPSRKPAARARAAPQRTRARQGEYTDGG